MSDVFALGLDISTTATKAVIVNADGNVVGAAAQEYGFDTPEPLWCEQDPALFWAGTKASIKAAVARAGIEPQHIEAIGLTGQMHGLVLLDGKDQVLRPCILWNDQRTGSQCDAIRAQVGFDRLLALTGNDALTGFTAPKILWVQEQEPDVWARTRHILLPKDYVRWQMSGEFATDVADGSGMLLLDIRQRQWSEEMLEALAIPKAYMPQAVEGTDISARLSPAAAQELGLKPGLPIAGGGGDQAAQAVGVGAVQEGLAAITLGTSGVVFAALSQPRVEPQGRLHAFCHAVPGRWHFMGVMLSAAGSLRWFRDTFAAGQDFGDLVAEAERIPAGCEGLTFLPYLTGERTPHPDPLARGAFVGLTVRHTLPHLTRAVLEGVACGLKDGYDLMLSAGLPELKTVRISGGGAQSPLWCQILADILGQELATVEEGEGAAFGAALLGGVAGGIWSDLDEVTQQVVEETGHISPDGDGMATMQAVHARFQDLYPALTPYSRTVA